MKKFIINCLLFITPLFFLIIEYVICDPFKVLHHYDNYYIDGDGGAVNRNYVSTMNYINKKEIYHYDSFIFGNSRSLFYMIDKWKNHLDSNSVCYHFSESGGSINGLYYKVKFIDESGEIIKNALFVIDYSLISNFEQDGRLFIMPPVLTNNSNFLKFHREHLSGFFDIFFWLHWTEYNITGKYREIMDKYIVKGTNYKYYNPITNEEPRTIQDSLIKMGKYFDRKIISEFEEKQFPDSIALPKIDGKKEHSLLEMQKILKKQHTKFRIVISPLYDQIKLNPKDYKILCGIFGKENVFDFSGVTKWSLDYRNYYEPSHYLPQVAAEIMDSIYACKMEH